LKDFVNNSDGDAAETGASATAATPASSGDATRS